MAEALGVAASILQVVSMGLQVSVYLYNFTETVSSAGRAIKEISDDISFTTQVLEQLRAVLASEKQNGTVSKEALATAENLVHECSKSFACIEAIIKKHFAEPETGKPKPIRGRAASRLHSLKWPFVQPRIEAQRANLERHKTKIILMTQVLTYAKMAASEQRNIEDKLEEERQKLEKLVIVSNRVKFQHRSKVNPFGLTEIFNPPSQASVDLVFVHGILGNPKDTWTSEETDVFWPAELLPPILENENARIMTYGYNAEPKTFVDGLSKHKIHDVIGDLGRDLASNRQIHKATSRPLLFVAHSLGGLIVKGVLTQSSQCAEQAVPDLRSIFISTYGIIFLSTPHVLWPSHLEIFCESAIRQKAREIAGNIGQLKARYNALREINHKFLDLADRYEFHCFREMLEPMCVDKFSARLSSLHVDATCVYTDHHRICKYGDESSPGFGLVCATIQNYMQQAPTVTQAKWQREQAKFVRNISPQSEMLPKTGYPRGSISFQAIGAPPSSFQPPVLSQPQALQCHYESLTSSSGASLYNRPSFTLVGLQEAATPELICFRDTGNCLPIYNNLQRPTQHHSQVHTAQQNGGQIPIHPPDTAYFHHWTPPVSQAAPRDSQIKLSIDSTSSRSEGSNLRVGSENPIKRQRIAQTQPPNERPVSAGESPLLPSTVDVVSPQRHQFQPSHQRQDPNFDYPISKTNPLRRESHRWQTDLRQTFHQDDGANMPALATHGAPTGKKGRSCDSGDEASVDSALIQPIQPSEASNRARSMSIQIHHSLESSSDKYLKVRSLTSSSSDNGWAPIDYVSPHVGAIFNPEQTLHPRTFSDSSRSDIEYLPRNSWESYVEVQNAATSSKTDSAGESDFYHIKSSPYNLERLSPPAVFTTAITRTSSPHHSPPSPIAYPRQSPLQSHQALPILRSQVQQYQPQPPQLHQPPIYNPSNAAKWPNLLPARQAAMFTAPAAGPGYHNYIPQTSMADNLARRSPQAADVNSIKPENSQQSPPQIPYQIPPLIQDLELRSTMSAQRQLKCGRTIPKHPNKRRGSYFGLMEEAESKASMHKMQHERNIPLPPLKDTNHQPSPEAVHVADTAEHGTSVLVPPLQRQYSTPPLSPQLGYVQLSPKVATATNARPLPSQEVVPGETLLEDPVAKSQEDHAEAIRHKNSFKARKRTKTGRLTCRRRFIKCGEERPICINCIKSKRGCEGYAPRLTFKDPLGFRPEWAMTGTSTSNTDTAKHGASFFMPPPKHRHPICRRLPAIVPSSQSDGDSDVEFAASRSSLDIDSKYSNEDMGEEPQVDAPLCTVNFQRHYCFVDRMQEKKRRARDEEVEVEETVTEDEKSKAREEISTLLAKWTTLEPTTFNV